MVQLTNKTQSSVFERSRGMEINAHQASNDSYYRKHKEDKRREKDSYPTARDSPEELVSTRGTVLPS